MIESVVAPKVDEHNSVRLEILDPVQKEIVTFLIWYHRSPLKVDSHKSWELIHSIGLLGILIQFLKSEQSVIRMRVTEQKYKLLLPFIHHCIAIYSRRESFSIEFRGFGNVGKKLFFTFNFLIIKANF